MDLRRLKDELLQHYPYRIELHAHTSPASICSEISPRELVTKYKELGFSAVTVTNHFQYGGEEVSKSEYIDSYLKDFEEAKEFGKQLGIHIYLGAEVRFTENRNDYLLLGVNKNILEDVYEYLTYGVKYFRTEYKLPFSVFLQAHPMRDHMQPVDQSLLDGLEVYNMHPNHNSRVGLVSLLSKEKDPLIITAGSDFHHPNLNHEGLGAIRTRCLPKDTFELAKLLKENDFLIEIGRNNLIVR